MARLPCFEPSQLEAIARVLGDTTNGLSGPDLGYILTDSKLGDPTPTLTKWKRLFNAFAEAQNKHQVGNPIIQYINKAMTPSRHLKDQSRFEWLQDNLNVALAFSGYGVNEKGQVIHATKEDTLDGAKARSKRLQTALASRNTHEAVMSYCKEELLQQNYFHAVLEAVKGLGERIRQMTGLTTDGAELINEALSTKKPLIKINSLTTETEMSEQKGIANLLIGVFGAIRNPTAHAPKVMWPMPEQDALDVLGILSYVHRKLDNAGAP